MFCVTDASFRSRLRSSDITAVDLVFLPHAIATTVVDASVQPMSLRTFPPLNHFGRAPRAREYQSELTACRTPRVNPRSVRLITEARHIRETDPSKWEDRPSARLTVDVETSMTSVRITSSRYRAGRSGTPRIGPRNHTPLHDLERRAVALAQLARERNDLGPVAELPESLHDGRRETVLELHRGSGRLRARRAPATATPSAAKPAADQEARKLERGLRVQMVV